MNNFFLNFLLIIAIPFTFFQDIMGGFPSWTQPILSARFGQEINKFIIRIRPRMPEWMTDPVSYFERELNLFGLV